MSVAVRLAVIGFFALALQATSSLAQAPGYVRVKLVKAGVPRTQGGDGVRCQYQRHQDFAKVNVRTGFSREVRSFTGTAIRQEQWGHFKIFVEQQRRIPPDWVFHSFGNELQRNEVDLLNVRPTTLAGVLALLQYANAADIDGMLWPTDLESDDGEKTRSWHYFLIESLAETLPTLAGIAA